VNYTFSHYKSYMTIWPNPFLTHMTALWRFQQTPLPRNVISYLNAPLLYAAAKFSNSIEELIYFLFLQANLKKSVDFLSNKGSFY